YLPDAEYPVILTSGRVHYHYHATISRRARGLEEICPEPYVEINPVDAARIGISEGEMLKLVSRHGEVEVKANVIDRVAPGVVFLSFHFAEARVNRIIGPALDPTAKIPEYKAGAVKVVKM
ncbi:MAG: molybdopterin dinucleotide binding domain-containing protein, partial [Bacillota bacterium]